MWKKDNPTPSPNVPNSGSGKRDTSGLMGVQAQIPEGAQALSGGSARNGASGDASSSVQARDAASSPPGGADPGGQWRPLTTFHAKGWDYFAILFVNFLLSLITLGVYSFWGKTKARAYLWSNIRVLGEPLEYTGTGKELFISFLMVMPFLFVFFFVFAFFAQNQIIAGQAALYLVLLFAWQFASYRALRYRLTRTRWRGIRGNLAGSAVAYACKAMGYLALALITLGLASPWISSRLAHLRLNNIWFGDRPLAFHGSSKELYKSFLIMFVSSVILAAALLGGGAVFSLSTYGLDFLEDIRANPSPFMTMLLVIYFLFIFGLLALTAFYRATYIRWIFQHIAFGQVRTRSTIKGRQLLGMRLTNALLVIFSLGFAYAWAAIRETKLYLHSLEHTGDPELASLLQDTQAAPGTGEGLLDALDVDMAF